MVFNDAYCRGEVNTELPLHISYEQTLTRHYTKTFPTQLYRHHRSEWLTQGR